jgi:hypothetical protein
VDCFGVAANFGRGVCVRKLNGRPTQSALRTLCWKHDLRIYALGATYTRTGSIHWGNGAKNVEASIAVADALRAEGYSVTLRQYDRTTGRTGQIQIEAKK